VNPPADWPDAVGVQRAGEPGGQRLVVRVRVVPGRDRVDLVEHEPGVGDPYGEVLAQQRGDLSRVAVGGRQPFGQHGTRDPPAGELDRRAVIGVVDHHDDVAARRQVVAQVRAERTRIARPR
jgi:hypothetical protein